MFNTEFYQLNVDKGNYINCQKEWGTDDVSSLRQKSSFALSELTIGTHFCSDGWLTLVRPHSFGC